jgi:hypothetical protein
MNTIAPGTKISITIVKKPTSAAAAKTLVRLLRKDRSVQKEAARLKKTRKTHFRQAARGGRLWNINVVTQPAVEAKLGVCKTITATLDVLTDLKSVSRFVEVKPA